MVIGLLAVTAIPTVIGVGQAVSAQKRANAQAKESVKFKLIAETLGGEALVVLVDQQIFVNQTTAPVKNGFPFFGYYFTYPTEEKLRGIVSFISDSPPALNWIFGDKSTGALRYGNKTASIEHMIGPWGWTDDEQYLTYKGSSLFLAVEESDQPEAEKKKTESQGLDPAEADSNHSQPKRWALYIHPRVSGVDPGIFRGRKGVQTKLIRHTGMGIKSQYLKQDRE